MTERTGYIDIVYADDKANGSMKRFGNLGINPVESRQVYGIDDVMKVFFLFFMFVVLSLSFQVISVCMIRKIICIQSIQENTRFIIHNFTEGEALRKRNDLVKAAMEAKNLRNLTRYAKNYQEQQGYFEEGMQLIYHYGMDARNDSASQNISDIRRTKRAHPEEAYEVKSIFYSNLTRFESFKNFL